MAQPATNPKIEELRFRLKTDPKSRLFYQLAEELRRALQWGEAEQVLRAGLGVYPTYLAAWVSLGRVLRDLKNETEAIEALNKAMQLDPGNVVAARLLADAHRALGDNVEAIKKYKLVHALMPGDEELKATIDQLERDLHPPEPLAVPTLVAASTPDPVPIAPVVPLELPIEDSPFDKTVPPFAESNDDAEPMLVRHDESPFEEPAEGATTDAFTVEQPLGMHIEPEPLSLEESGELEELVADVFETSDVDHGASELTSAEQVTDTSTMADLYARQGLLNEARHIYENILAREPGNTEVRAKLETITPRVNPRIARLERWLTKVSRKEVGRV